MILAMIRVMALGLLRDRGALILAFVLPPAIFLIFASIFAATTSDRPQLNIAIAQPGTSPVSLRLEDALRGEPSLRVLDPTRSSRADVARLVENGVADAGIVIGPDPEDDQAPAITVLVEPSKLMAGAMLSGQVQSIVARRLPDLVLSRAAAGVEAAVGGFTPEQAARLSAVVEALSREGRNDGMKGGPGLLETVTVGQSQGADATITYYAGAVAILFLLFSALQNAATLIEERKSGILDRIAAGPAGTDVVIIGKFIFLALLGVIQVALIFAIAALAYDVEVAARIGPWLLTTVAAALASSGLALAVVTVCTTRQQAQTVSTFVVLICSAIGGSMVPRFMMPEWLQHLGRFTPNTWAIEAYYGVLWRGEALSAVLPEIVCLLTMAVAGAVFAIAVSRLRLRF